MHAGAPLQGLLTERLWLEAADAAAVSRWGLGFPVRVVADADGRVATAPPVGDASVRAELLRAALWRLSHGGRAPVYIMRLLNAVRTPLRVLAAGAPRPAVPARQVPANDVEVAADTDRAGETVLRDTLEDLMLLGDVAGVPGGYWLPAPGRVVPLAGGGYLLIGGHPTWLLPERLRRVVAPQGLVRLLPAGADEAAPELAELPVQADESWRHRPPGPIGAWAVATLDGAAVLPFEDVSVTFECYATALAVAECARRGGRPPDQYHRWRPVTAAIPDGRYVLKYASAMGRRYAVGDVVRGRVVAVGQPVLGAGDWRRLLYGLDAAARCPTHVEARRARDGTLGLTLRSALPGAEARLLTAVGRLAPGAAGQYYPQEWTVPVTAVADVLIALTRDLGVALDDLGAARQSAGAAPPSLGRP